MKKFKIYYNYVIFNKKKEYITKSEKGTLEMEAERIDSLDTAKIRQEIRHLAFKMCGKDEEIQHANYYEIEELI